MVCKNCGHEIEEGADFCLECGESISEPVVITNIKVEKKPEKREEDIDYGDLSKYDISGYINSLGNNKVNLLAFFGAFLVYLSPFFTWLHQLYFGEEEKGSLFDIAGKNLEIATDSAMLKFVAILIIVVGILMLIVSASAYLGPIKKYQNKDVFRYLPVILGTVAVIIVFADGAYPDAIDAIEVMTEKFRAVGAGKDIYDGGPGVGPLLFILGMVLYIISLLLYKKERKSNG